MQMKVGLQTYTVRNSFIEDSMETLKKIAEVGYKIIELANHSADVDCGTGIGIPAKNLKAKADELGIEIIGAHVLPTDRHAVGDFYKNKNNVLEIIRYYSELNSKFISIPIDFFPNKDFLLKRCELYNEVGRMFYESGIKFLYHNHSHDFQAFDNRAIMSLIMDNTDPRYMSIEWDTYNTMRGLLDPVKQIHQYGERIAIIHQKDFPLEQVQNLSMWGLFDKNVPLDWEKHLSAHKPEYFIEIGEGIMKIQDIIDAGNKFNIPYLLVEQDYSNMGEIESITKSMNNLKKMRGLSWD